MCFWDADVIVSTDSMTTVAMEMAVPDTADVAVPMIVVSCCIILITTALLLFAFR